MSDRKNSVLYFPHVDKPDKEYNEEEVNRKISFYTDLVLKEPCGSINEAKYIMKLARLYKVHLINKYSDDQESDIHFREYVDKGVDWLEKGIQKKIPDAYWTAFLFFSKNKNETYFPAYGHMFADNYIFCPEDALVRSAMLGHEKGVGVVLHAVKNYKDPNMQNTLYTLMGYGFDVSDDTEEMFQKLRAVSRDYTKDGFDTRRHVLSLLYKKSAYEFSGNQPVGNLIALKEKPVPLTQKIYSYLL